MTNKTVLMMAAGTGGHVFPALAVADELAARGVNIHWLGTPTGMENELVSKHGYTFHAIDMQGLRGKGLARMLKLPFMLFGAVRKTKAIITQNNISAAVGFGGYVTAPGGLACKWAGKPLIIHEQNAIAGMSNKNLARYADNVLQAFDGVFDFMASSLKSAPITVGNPVRSNIASIPLPSERYQVSDTSPLKVLVVGGSLGAAAINKAIVEMLQQTTRPLSVRHQCGKANHQEMLVAYSQAGIDTSLHTFEVLPFIDDMAAAYTWADVIVCRAGALTVTEISNAGVAAIFVPLPHAVDDHQTANAKYLTDQKAGILMPQSSLTGKSLSDILSILTRQECLEMAKNARALAHPDSTKMVADIVWQKLV